MMCGQGGFFSRWRSAWRLASLLVLAACTSSPAVGAQDSAPLSPDTALIWRPTGPLEEFVSRTLRPLLAEGLESSTSTDARLSELERQIERDRLERQQEQIDWRITFEALSSRADQLQSFFGELSGRLTSFSGDEEQQYRLAVQALDGIQKKAAAVELENRLLRIGCVVLGTLVLAGAGYAGGHAAGWW